MFKTNHNQIKNIILCLFIIPLLSSCKTLLFASSQDTQAQSWLTIKDPRPQLVVTLSNPFKADELQVEHTALYIGDLFVGHLDKVLNRQVPIRLLTGKTRIQIKNNQQILFDREVELFEEQVYTIEI